MRDKTVVVTGAGGGLGAATATALADRGWQVFGGDLDPAAVPVHDRVTPVSLDVTDSSSVAVLRDTIAAATDGIDAVVNFAGVLAVGSLVELSEAEFVRVFDVNVLGTFRVNRALFALVHARRGRLVNISSETGWQTPMPFNGAYAASKHAIEAYSDALRRELALLGMPVIKIQPGPFKTDMVSSIEDRFDRAATASRYFEPVLRGMMAYLAAEQARANDPRALAEVVVQACEARSPRAAYSVRPDPSRRLLQWMPDRWVDGLLTRFLRRS